VTCLDLGRSGGLFTQGWDRQVDKTGSEGKALKRMINTQVIYPPIDGTAEDLLASSSIDLAARTRRLDGPKAKPEPVAGEAA
jgi:NADH dehydrogenase